MTTPPDSGERLSRLASKAREGLQMVKGPATRMVGITFISAAVSRAGQFLLAIVFAHMAGPEIYGTFTFALGLATLVAFLVNFGWPNMVNRLMPEMHLKRQWGLMRGFVDGADLFSVCTSILGILAILASGYFFPHLREGLALGSAMLVPLALTRLRRQELAAVKRPAWGLSLDQGFAAWSTLAFVLLSETTNVVSVGLVFALANLLGVGVGTLIFRHRLPAEAKRAQRLWDWRRWLRMGGTLWIGNAADQMMKRTDIVMLGPLSTLSEVGIYGAAFRLTYFMSFPQYVVMTVVTPRLSEAFARGQAARARRLMRAVHLFAFATALPVAVVLGVFAEPVMVLIFGKSFANGSLTLMLLAVSQAMDAFIIGFSSLLMMGNKEKELSRQNLAALAANLLLNLILVPTFGAPGAASATLTVTIMLLWSNYRIARGALDELEAATGTA